MGDVPAGLYEHLITDRFSRDLTSTAHDLIQIGALDPADAHEALARHIAGLTSRALRAAGGGDSAAVSRQVELANRIVAAIGDLAPEAADSNDAVTDPVRQLLAVAAPNSVPGPVSFPERPAVPLSTSALLVNGRGQPRIGYEVTRELASADGVDLLCAFIKWQGLRVLAKALIDLRERGGRLRVITTTYMGATDQRALDRLVELGADVKISYETRTTRLHAKAWLFRRATGLSTAYVGSSNMSRTALTDGLEWNVRLSNVEQAHLLETFAETFDSYWADPSFETYDPARDGDRLREALNAERGGPSDLPIQITSLDVRPFGYQREILDELEAQRTIHNRWRNLVVMATGTGKTVVSALDYKRLRDAGTVDRILFIAHREELLVQSLSTFRHVLRQGDFGELYVAGQRPREWRHVFGSVQSLTQLDRADLDPAHFDMIVVDEFHHAMASTYRRLLEHVAPKVLVGLTATPERTDGADVREWFDGRTAVELRLWEALEQGLLAPFQYFGLHDDVALEQVRWKRGRGYDLTELTNVYTGDDHRVRLILQAVHDKVENPGRMRALGFCVSIQHAEFMAERFSAAGIPSRAITSQTSREERAAALVALRERQANVLFTVDLFNEGLDIPTVDTVLFLRPTESATVFLQQLGRGLRLSEDKACLTVLDFIGAQHQEFRFDLRFRALTGSSRRGLQRDVEQGFPTLPAGCHIELDRVAQRIVLENIKQSLNVSWKGLVAEARSLERPTMAEFLDEAGIELEDLYRGNRRSWLDLQRAAERVQDTPGPDDRRLANAFARMLHIDDLERLQFIREIITAAGTTDVTRDARSRRLAAMLHFSLFGQQEQFSSIEASLDRLLRHPSRAEELTQLTDVLVDRLHRVTPKLTAASARPLHLHARYTQVEALAAFGRESLANAFGAGVWWIPDESADLFFVTLQKTELHYSPTTMYADHAISPSIFQWESQNTTRPGTGVGNRYIHHRELGTSVHLFLRETKTSDGNLGAPPYLYAGPMTYLSHTGERPMRILWNLEHALPADVFHAAKVA
ncbi:superfamily II DNA or RNA helicase [Blastococcus colisei]|uniref:Superfamily II DNA or RNA helicase n=1 Tax=Blastococcus colisei TaxID=1564162 RepID=A0A543PDF3_9ACTN|nr:DEAD/DEAH box helicase [Blastococcus colisei]TQN42115.1 superfamily II DNA or RNA helicase [Blastococcus colisei]